MVGARKREGKKNQRMILKDKQHLSEEGRENYKYKVTIHT